MEAMRAHFEREAGIEGPWTSYNASLGRPLLDSRKFLQGEKPQAAKAGTDDPSMSSATAPTQPTTAAPIVDLDLDLFSEQKA